MSTTFILICAATLFFVGACKPTKDVVSKNKDLVGLASGDFRGQQCRNPGVDPLESPLNTESNIFEGPDLSGKYDQFRLAFLKGLTSVPLAYQQILSETLEVHIGNQKIHTQCMKQDRKTGPSAVKGPAACWFVDSKKEYVRNKTHNLIVSFYPEKPSDVHEGVVRIFGAVIGDVWVRSMGEFFVGYREAVTQTFLYDVIIHEKFKIEDFQGYIAKNANGASTQIQAEYASKIKPAIEKLLSELPGKSFAEKVANFFLLAQKSEIPPDLMHKVPFEDRTERSSFEGFTFSHAFESWYCTEKGENSTRFEMERHFPVTYQLFSAIESDFLSANEGLVAAKLSGKMVDQKEESTGFRLLARRYFFDGRGWWPGKAIGTFFNNTPHRINARRNFYQSNPYANRYNQCGFTRPNNNSQRFQNQPYNRNTGSINNGPSRQENSPNPYTRNPTFTPVAANPVTKNRSLNFGNSMPNYVPSGTCYTGSGVSSG